MSQEKLNLFILISVWVAVIVGWFYCALCGLIELHYRADPMNRVKDMLIGNLANTRPGKWLYIAVLGSIWLVIYYW